MKGTAASAAASMSSLLVLRVQFARRVFARGRAAGDGEEVGREGEKAFDREPPRHVLDMRIEPAVLVNDDHGGTLAAGGAAHEIAVDLALG